MSFTDNISELPLDILLIIGLNVSLDELKKLRSSSRKLNDLCCTEMFWKCRLTQDYPRYAPVHPLALSYEEHYHVLDHVHTFRTHEGRTLLEPIINEHHAEFLYLLYPVPLFNVSEGKLWESDIMIIMGEKTVIIASRQRRCLLGDVPLVGESLSTKKPSREEQKKVDHLIREGWNEIITISPKLLPRFLYQAGRAGYLYYTPHLNKLYSLTLEEIEKNCDLFRFLPSKRVLGKSLSYIISSSR